MGYTPEQRDAITTHDRNLIVTAGAGSGKTRVLVDRFVALLESHPDWPLSSLVAITFTEKAAREMRDRVRQAIEDRLREATQSGDHGAVARWRDHQSALDAARIGTIHSLCANILRANAAEAGIDPAFEVLDEVASHVLRREAVEQAAAALGESRDGARLLREYGVETVTGVLRDHIATPDALLPTEINCLNDWRMLYEQHAADALERLRRDADLRAALNWAPPGGWPDGDKLLAPWALVHETGDVVLADEASAEDVFAVLERWAGEIKLVGGTQKAWGGKDLLDQAKAYLTLIRDRARAVIAEVGSFGADDERAAALLPTWGQAIRRAQETYLEVKARQHTLDFDDLESLTQRLLKNPAVARRYQDEEFRHLLVDEFQDTNNAQRDIITALTGTRHGSLFVVGDPRQSIYRFRGADVRVFNRIRWEIVASGGREIELNVSFRTHNVLLDAFQDIFSKLMISGDGPNADFAVALGSPLVANRQRIIDHARADDQPGLEVILIDKDRAPENASSADDLRRWEAFTLAWRIREMVESGWQVWDRTTDGQRPLGYGDVAILFQSSNGMPMVEEAFKSADIPYVTVAGKGYYSRPEVWDLLNLLKALYNPPDDLALATALRSPLFGLSDDDLLALRLQRALTSEGAYAPRLSLWNALTDATRVYDPALPFPERIAFARDALLRLRGVAGRVSIAELLGRANDESAFLATLSGLPDGARRVANVAKLIELARRNAQVSLGDFVLLLDDLSEREVREGEALLEREGAAQLMTVHASKGLEFPVVALFDASFEGRSSDAALVLDPVLGPVCRVRGGDGNKAEPFVYRLAKTYEAERDEAERTRLLYVAMTRAQDYVIISGRSNGKGQWLRQLIEALELPGNFEMEEDEATIVPRPWGGCLLRLPAHPGPDALAGEESALPSAWDHLSGEPIPGVTAIQPPLVAVPPRDEQAPARALSASHVGILGESLAEGHPARFRNRVLHDAPEALRPIPAIEGGPPISDRLIGNIVHQALRWNHLPGNTPNLREILDSYTWEQGISDAQRIEAAIQQSTDLLQRTEASDVITEIQQAQQVYRELPFSYQFGTRTIHGVIDVLYFSKYGKWVVVDYKTAHVGVAQGEDRHLRIRDHAARYFAQVALYAAAVEASTGQAPDVFIHYVRYVYTVRVAPETWREVLGRLDEDIVAALAQNSDGES